MVQMIWLLCFLAPAAAHVWDGTFTGNHIHKSLQVCVDCDGKTCYGQGLIDERSYLRGTIIDAGNTSSWTGTYYLPGRGSIPGAFSLTLSAGKYTGTFETVHAYDLKADTAVSGSRVSDKMPTDSECFRADLDYVKDDDKGFVNGLSPPTALFPMDAKSFDKGIMTGSYLYVPGERIKGTQHGNCYLGRTQFDVCTTTWYEHGSDQGISLLVAKNATHSYDVWYFIPSLESFEPKHIDDETDCYHNQHHTFIYEHGSGKPDLVLKRSIEHACSAMWEQDMEDQCYAEFNSDKSDKSDCCAKKKADKTKVSGSHRAGSTLGLGLIVLYMITFCQFRFCIY